MQLPFHMTHLAVTQWQNNAMVTQLGFAAVSIKFFEHGDGTLGSCLRMPKAPGFSVELPNFGRFMVFPNIFLAGDAVKTRWRLKSLTIW